MANPRKRPRLFRDPPKTLFEDSTYEAFETPVKGPLFSKALLYTLLALFGLSLMLTADWFGLMLLNGEGVYGKLGPLNAVRVTAVLMAGIALPSALLIFHYRRIYSYISDENVFFTIAFSLSFLLGSPCALAGIFG